MGMSIKDDLYHCTIRFLPGGLFPSHSQRRTSITLQVLESAVICPTCKKCVYVPHHDDKATLAEILFLLGCVVGDKQLCKTVSGLRKFFSRYYCA